MGDGRAEKHLRPWHFCLPGRTPPPASAVTPVLPHVARSLAISVSLCLCLSSYFYFILTEGEAEEGGAWGPPLSQFLPGSPELLQGLKPRARISQLWPVLPASDTHMHEDKGGSGPGDRV